MPKLLYEGSVKNLWEAGADRIEFEYTDAYSVFDWGRMPDALSHKGEALAALGAYFFKAASESGSWKNLGQSKWLAGLARDLREKVTAEAALIARDGFHHHFIERSKPNRLLVNRVEVTPPEERKLGGQTLYDYSGAGKTDAASRLIPLEVVFRFGMPQGSSLTERLTPAYARQLGFDKAPSAGKLFAIPCIEFFSKLEDTDRFLTWEQALNYSGLDYAQFEQLVARTFCLAIWLHEMFQAKGLELWDGKFEWALISGRLALVDSIGPDELRLLDPKTGTQISKEFLRMFYRETPWFEAVKEAKRLAATDPALDWKQHVRKTVGEPPVLSDSFRAAAVALYPSLAVSITGENPGNQGVPLSQMLERIRKCLGK